MEHGNHSVSRRFGRVASFLQSTVTPSKKQARSYYVKAFVISWFLRDASFSTSIKRVKFLEIRQHIVSIRALWNFTCLVPVIQESKDVDRDISHFVLYYISHTVPKRSLRCEITIRFKNQYWQCGGNRGMPWRRVKVVNLITSDNIFIYFLFSVYHLKCNMSVKVE